MPQDQPAKTKKFLSFSNVAFMLAGASLLSQLLGFWRTKLVNAYFPLKGPNSIDSYFAAFNIPDFFFYTLAAGALGVAFIPVLADRLQRGDKKGMWEITSSLLNLLCIVMFVVALTIFIFAEPLLHHMVSSFTPPQLHNAVVIMRFLALNPLFFTASGILTSMQQTLGRFFFFAVAPLFYNLSIIVSIFIFRNTSFGLKGLGVGACIGGALQLAVVCIGLIGTKFRWSPKIMWRSSDFKTVLRQLPPRAFDQGMDQIQTIVETRYARRLGEGYITSYNNAAMLQTAPTLLIGTAISTAAFPRLAKRLSQGRPDLFRRDFLRILRFIIWLTIPVVVVSFFDRGYLARIIFERGSPTIALIFGYLTTAIFFQTIYALVSRWFYAQKDTKTPLFVSIFTVTLNIILAATLARAQSYGAAGLAMSVSLASMAEVLVLGTIMVIRDRGLLNMAFWGGVGRIVSVGGFTLVVGFLAISFYPLGAADRGFDLLVKPSIIAAAVFGTHVLLSGLFGLEEAQPIFRWLRQRFTLRPTREGPFNPQ